MRKGKIPDLDKYLVDGKGRRFVNYAQGAKLYRLPYWSFVRVAKEADGFDGRINYWKKQSDF